MLLNCECSLYKSSSNNRAHIILKFIKTGFATKALTPFVAHLANDCKSNVTVLIL